MKKLSFHMVAIFLPVLLCADLPFPQEPNQIMKKLTDALGGEKNIADIKALSGKAKISMAGIEGEMQVWWSGPDKVRQEFHFPVSGPLIVSDGESFWMEDETGAARKLGEQKWMELLDQVFLENYEYLLSGARKERADLVMGRSETDPGYFVLDLISDDGGLKRVFIDDSSYLIDKYHNFANKESVTVRFSDYRDVGGVKFPFRVHRTAGAPHANTFVEFVEIMINPALPETLFVKPEGACEDYRFVSNSGRIRVPFELVDNHIYFKVKVNDSPLLSFLLDTGAQLSYLDLSKANELGVRETDAAWIRRVGSCDDLSFFKLDSVKTGLMNPSSDVSDFAKSENLTLFDQIMAGISLAQVEKFDGKRIDGIFGYDFLRRFVVEIDYLDQVLTLYEAKTFKYTGSGEAIRINLQSYIPTIKAVVDGECEGMFKIDTGSRNNLDLCPAFVKKHEFLERYPNYVETPIGFGIADPYKGAVGRVKNFQLGPFHISSPVTGYYLEHRNSLGSAKIAGTIGGGILKKFKVILDYPRYRVIFEKNANYHLRDRFNTSGMHLIQEGEKVFVYHVIESSPAEKAKIKEGDELLSINGVRVSFYSLQRIKETLNQKEGIEIKLKLRRSTKTEEVSLILKEMI
jgi:hypothetical protein